MRARDTHACNARVRAWFRKYFADGRGSGLGLVLVPLRFVCVVARALTAGACAEGLRQGHSATQTDSVLMHLSASRRKQNTPPPLTPHPPPQSGAHERSWIKLRHHSGQWSPLAAQQHYVPRPAVTPHGGRQPWAWAIIRWRSRGGHHAWQPRSSCSRCWPRCLFAGSESGGSGRSSGGSRISTSIRSSRAMPSRSVAPHLPRRASHAQGRTSARGGAFCLADRSSTRRQRGPDGLAHPRARRMNGRETSSFGQTVPAVTVGPCARASIALVVLSADSVVVRPADDARGVAPRR